MGIKQTKVGKTTENEIVELLGKNGWWVHFLSKDKTGQQPCDIIGIYDDTPILMDAKHLSKESKGIFSFDRIETNQLTCFELASRNCCCGFVIKDEFTGKLWWVNYIKVKLAMLDGKKSINVKDLWDFKEYFDLC